MDKASADGMKTADAAVAAVDGWARVRDDSSSVEWVVYVLDGKTYRLAAEGSGRPELLNALDEASVNFCGLLDGPNVPGGNSKSVHGHHRCEPFSLVLVQLPCEPIPHIHQEDGGSD